MFFKRFDSVNAASGSENTPRMQRRRYIFFIEFLAVHVEHRRSAENLRVARPAQSLVALRTVGGNA